TTRKPHWIRHAPRVVRVLLGEVDECSRREVAEAFIVPERSRVVLTEPPGGLARRGVNPAQIRIELRKRSSFVVTMRDRGQRVGIALDEAPALKVPDGT